MGCVNSIRLEIVDLCVPRTAFCLQIMRIGGCEPSFRAPYGTAALLLPRMSTVLPPGSPEGPAEAQTLPPSPPRSTAGPAKRLTGGRRPKHLMSIYSQVNKPVLRRPVEPGLFALVGVVDQAGLGLAAGDGHLERVDDEFGAQVVAHRPADNAAGEAVDPDAR